MGFFFQSQEYTFKTTVVWSIVWFIQCWSTFVPSEWTGALSDLWQPVSWKVQNIERQRENPHQKCWQAFEYVISSSSEHWDKQGLEDLCKSRYHVSYYLGSSSWIQNPSYKAVLVQFPLTHKMYHLSFRNRQIKSFMMTQETSLATSFSQFCPVFKIALSCPALYSTRMLFTCLRLFQVGIKSKPLNPNNLTQTLP